MLKSCFRLSCACVLPIVLCSIAFTQELNLGHKETLANSLRLEKRLSETQRRQLSSATQNRFALAHEILEIFVAYVAETSLDEQIIFRRSSDGGLTFSDSTSVAGAILAGLGGAGRLQSLIQTNSFPSLSIDRSQGASRGTLYLTWIDASRHQIPDSLAPTQTYGFGQAVLSKSTDQGRTWTTAAPIVSTPAHREQFLPSAAVDRDGTLAICYFDRRNDPENNGVDHYCSVSRDQGISFTHLRNTHEPFTPAHLTDGLMDPVNFGDYDIVSSDATGANAGFFSTFQTQSTGDANIVGVRF